MSGVRPDKIDNSELLESVSETPQDSQERPASSSSSQVQQKEGIWVLYTNSCSRFNSKWWRRRWRLMMSFVYVVINLSESKNIVEKRIG